MSEFLYNGWLKIKEIFYNERKYEKLVHKDAVSAIVFNSNNEILLVKQYRPCVGEFTWELPAGVTDKEGLNNEEILIEELKEEGNIDKDDIYSFKKLSEYYMLIGCTDAKMSIYTVKLNKVIDDINSKDLDVIEIKWLTFQEFEEKIKNKNIQDQKTILAYYLVKEEMLNEKSIDNSRYAK